VRIRVISVIGRHRMRIIQNRLRQSQASQAAIDSGQAVAADCLGFREYSGAPQLVAPFAASGFLILSARPLQLIDMGHLSARAAALC